MLNQYRGLKREIYVLFYGRVVTSMGAVIWPMMTLILSNKMNMNAETIAMLLMVMGLAQLPFTLCGGGLADCFNKKYNIIFCDLVTVASYLICGMIPLSNVSLVLFFIASAFAALEHPSYQALIADLTDSDERERAYSLSYLGANLGLVLAPTIGGFLFENHLNFSFVITSLATLSSTLLILCFVKDIKKANDITTKNSYESNEAPKRFLQIFIQHPCICLYIFLMGMTSLVYSQFNFLMPLNMEMQFGVAGAKYFGMMTSVNGLVVIMATPVITTLLKSFCDTKKMRLGIVFEVGGLAMFMVIQGILWPHFIAIIIFTIGEVIHTLGMAPYTSLRIPASYRGRIHAIELIFTNSFQTIAQLAIAYLVDRMVITSVWACVVAIGFIVIAGFTLLIRIDRRAYPLLQKSSDMKE